jgi:hypothetical protein
MALGVWDESRVLYKRARFAYQLCGDLESVEKCHRWQSWQELYGGSLFDCEQRYLSLIESGTSETADTDPYWLALILAIRRSKWAAPLLRKIGVGNDRWRMQTVAEAYYYLGKDSEAASLAADSLSRKSEIVVSAQVLWELVTIGLAKQRIGELDDSESYLDRALAHSAGLYYKIVGLFSLAGLIECLCCKAERAQPTDRMRLIGDAENLYKRYLRSDPGEQFQIPASEAHLAMARIASMTGELEKARLLAERSLTVAVGLHSVFGYASVVERAKSFIQLHFGIECVPVVAQPSYDERQHEDQLADFLQKYLTNPSQP